MGEMAVMGQRGDSKQIWNPRDADEVEAARKHFKNLVAKGFAAFRVKRDGEKGERVREFDPEAAKLIMVPPMAGGASAWEFATQLLERYAAERLVPPMAGGR